MYKNNIILKTGTNDSLLLNCVFSLLSPSSCTIRYFALFIISICSCKRNNLFSLYFSSPLIIYSIIFFLSISRAHSEFDLIFCFKSNTLTQHKSRTSCVFSRRSQRASNTKNLNALIARICVIQGSSHARWKYQQVSTDGSHWLCVFADLFANKNGENDQCLWRWEITCIGVLFFLLSLFCSLWFCSFCVLFRDLRLICFSETELHENSEPNEKEKRTKLYDFNFFYQNKKYIRDCSVFLSNSSFLFFQWQVFF